MHKNNVPGEYLLYYFRLLQLKPDTSVAIMNVVEKVGLLFADQVTPGSNDSLTLDNLGTRHFVTVHLSLVSSMDVLVCMFCYIDVNLVSTKRSYESSFSFVGLFTYNSLGCLISILV